MWEVVDRNGGRGTEDRLIKQFKHKLRTARAAYARMLMSARMNLEENEELTGADAMSDQDTLAGNDGAASKDATADSVMSSSENSDEDSDESSDEDSDETDAQSDVSMPAGLDPVAKFR